MIETKRRPRLAEGLRALDELTGQQAMPAELYAGLMTRLAASGRRRVARPLGLAAAALALFVLLGVWLWPRAHDLAGFEIVTASSGARWHGGASAAFELDEGTLRLRVLELGAALEVAAGAQLRREPGAIRVLAGRVRFDIAPRVRGSVAVRVLVSHGVIEIMGTRFAVEQGRDGGSVLLDSGQIRFVASDGTTVALQPGQSLHWPLASAAVAPSTIPSPVPPRPEAALAPAARRQRPPAAPQARPASSLEPVAKFAAPAPRFAQDFMLELDALRIRHDYARLSARLAELLATDVGEPGRERLSFELCDVLLQHGGERAEACAHVAEHLHRYPGGEHTTALQQAQAAHACLPTRILQR